MALNKLMKLSIMAGCAMGLAAPVLAQPANRVVAIATAVAEAEDDNAGFTALEAELKPRNGSWVVEVELGRVNNGQLQLREVKLNATTFAVVETENETDDDAAEKIAVLNRISEVTVTPDTALATAAGSSTVAGAALKEYEIEIEGGVLVYDVEFTLMGVEKKVRVNAATGAIVSSGFGGGSDDDDDADGDDDNCPGHGGLGGDDDLEEELESEDAVAIARDYFPGAMVLQVDRVDRRRDEDDFYKVRVMVGGSERIICVREDDAEILEVSRARSLSGTTKSVQRSLTANPSGLLVSIEQATDATRAALPAGTAAPEIDDVKLTIVSRRVVYRATAKVDRRSYNVTVDGQTGQATVRRR
jgi:uncharacterized membrane protein YkoI